ncbi:hypothetical protein [Amorphus orientalis]|uniref:DNA ligase-1 n=1 Tax=Amorphus orientalis TaxID=649198 RepID=A0AAE3VTW1_9HYPH|nr:hypothetical protein [Amorphus orientalis]MDQ0317755.1 DNA ligase-1 [Amorphus orientalis]
MQFRPMLAETADLSKLVFPLIAQPKFDGIRCVVLPGLGPVTRTLKPIPNLEIRAALSHPDFLHHDGEIVTYTDGAPDELNTVQSKVMSAGGEWDFCFHTFDHVEHPGDPYRSRWRRVTAGRRAECELVVDAAELIQFEENLVSAGWEGVIVRRSDAPYKFGRSTLKEGALLKIKRFVDDEAEVIAFVERRHNTNEQTRDERGYAKRSTAKAGMVGTEMLGALVLRWKDGIEFELGTGFTQAQRLIIWANQRRYLGRKVTFKYQRTGPKGAPLLPVFKAFRSVEDI